MAAMEDDKRKIVQINLQEQWIHKDDDDISRKRHLKWWEACLCKLTVKYKPPRKVVYSNIFYVSFFLFFIFEGEWEKQCLTLLLNTDVMTFAKFLKPKPDS